MSKQIYNFCAGPAMLPVEVMERAQREFCNFQGLGASVMELSHRGKPYMAVAEKAEAEKAAEIERMVTQLYQGARTISLLPSIRGRSTTSPSPVSAYGRRPNTQNGSTRSAPASVS